MKMKLSGCVGPGWQATKDVVVQTDPSPTLIIKARFTINGYRWSDHPTHIVARSYEIIGMRNGYRWQEYAGICNYFVVPKDALHIIGEECKWGRVICTLGQSEHMISLAANVSRTVDEFGKEHSLYKLNGVCNSHINMNSQSYQSLRFNCYPPSGHGSNRIGGISTLNESFFELLTRDVIAPMVSRGWFMQTVKDCTVPGVYVISEVLTKERKFVAEMGGLKIRVPFRLVDWVKTAILNQAKIVLPRPFNLHGNDQTEAVEKLQQALSLRVEYAQSENDHAQADTFSGS